jgi:hypothetical protein
LEEKKYIDEQTTHLSKKEKQLWLEKYEEEKEIIFDFTESERCFNEYQTMQKRCKEDKERLDNWNKKHY